MAPRSRPRLWLRWLVGLLLLPFLLVAIVVVLLYVPPVQHFVRGKAVEVLSERLGTRVELERLHLRFPLGIKLKGLYVEDQQGDTLLYAGTLRTRAGLRKLLGGELLLDPIDLRDVRATLHQHADSSFNFQFIIDAFVDPDAPPAVEDPADTTGGFSFAIGAVRVERLHFDMRMEPSALELDLRLGELAMDFDRFTLDPMAFHVDHLLLKDTRLHLRSPSNEPTPPSYPDLENPLADIDVRFRGIALEHVAFSMTTTDTGDSLWLAVDRAGLKTRSMDLTRQQLHLGLFDVDGLHFGLLGMTRDAASDPQPTGDPLWLDRHDGFRYWTQDWDLRIDRLRVANSAFALHADSIDAPALLFDPDHLVLSDMALDAHDVAVSNSRIAMGMKQVLVHAGPERTPLRLALGLDVRPDSLALHDGSLQAMGNSFQFALAAQPGDLSKAYRDLYEVPIQVEASTALRMDRLLPLLEGFGVELPRGAATEERWDTRLWLTGTPRRADRMGLQLTGDQGSRVKLEGRIRQADRWPHNNFELALDELVMGRGMYQVARAFTPPDITLPLRLSMRGNMSGEAGTVRTVLAMDSDLGRLTGFAVVNDWSGLYPDGLDVALTAGALDVGRFIGDTALAPLSFKVIAGGARLNSPDRVGDLLFTPSVLTYAGNDLSSLRLGLTARGEELGVDLSAQAAPADILLQAKGPWPREGDSLALDLDLITRHLHLQALDLTPHALSYAGRINGSLAFTTDGFGSVRLKGEGVRLFNETRSFNFERFALGARLSADSTAVELDSDAITLAYHSNLGIDSIVPRTQAKLASFFQEDGLFEPQPGKRMDLAITLPRTEWLTEIVVPGLDAMELRTFTGSYDSDSDELKLNIDVPHVDYDGTDLHGLTVDVDAVGNRLNGALRLRRVDRDSLYLEHLSLEARSLPDTLHIAFRMKDDAGDERYRVGVGLRREDKVPVLHMDRAFLLNRRNWTAHPENALFLSRDGLRAEHFELESSGEAISLRTGRQRNHIEFTEFRLSTFGELVSTADSVSIAKGRLNGTLSLPFTDEGRLGADLLIRRLEVMGVRMGDLAIQATEMEDKHFRGQVALSDSLNRMQAKADADLRGEAMRIRADAELAFGDLGFLRPFVKDYLFSIEGGLNGRLRYEQDGDDIRILGKTTFKNAGVGVIQTGSVYRMPNETVVFDADGLLFENVTVLDANDNRFRLDGRVSTAMGELPALDLRLRTERFQLVNSTIEQNPMFFGQLFGSIDLRIDGPAISPEVRGDVGILEGTALSIVLPGSSVEMIDHEGIVLFTTDFDAQDTLQLSTDGQMLRDSLAAQLPGVALDLRVRLDKRATFAVVIDPTTGDQATFSGEADLRFRYSPDGDIDLRGPFTVGEGGYTLEFYGLVKKRFDLVPGGTVVFDGDPLKGRMNIQARFRSDTAPYGLVANARSGLSESERNRLQQRLPFDVLINIRELVENPTITFGLELDRMSRNSFPQVSSRLDQLAQPANEEELNRQVFGLLVLNTFIVDEGASGQPSSGLATSAARNSVNALLTDQLNRVTGQMVRGMDIQLGVNTYDQAAGGELYQRTTVDYKVTQRILNDRVTIEAGGSIGVDERDQNVSAVSNTRAAQYAISYDLTEDGRYRLRAFHENAFDLYDGEIFNNGVAITHTREWEENAKDRERRRKLIREERNGLKREEE